MFAPYSILHYSPRPPQALPIARGWIVGRVFIFGPAALWIAVGLILLDRRTAWIAAPDPGSRRSLLRDATSRLAAETLPLLLILPLYLRWGGEIPIAGVRVRPLLMAVSVLAVALLIRAVLRVADLAYHAWAQARPDQAPAPDLLLAVAPLALAHLADPFGVLAAGIYVEAGASAFLFIGAGSAIRSAVTVFHRLAPYPGMELGSAVERSSSHRFEDQATPSQLEASMSSCSATGPGPICRFAASFRLQRRWVR